MSLKNAAKRLAAAAATILAATGLTLGTGQPIAAAASSGSSGSSGFSLSSGSSGSSGSSLGSSLGSSEARLDGMSFNQSRIIRGGASFWVQRADGSVNPCTVTNVVRKGNVNYAVTAGHCISGHVTQIRHKGQVIADAADVRAGWHIVQGNKRPGGHFINDFGYFRLKPHVKVQYNVVHLDRVHPVHQPASAATRAIHRRAVSAPFGAPLRVHQGMIGRIACKEGNTTGLTCGPIVRVNEKTQDVSGLIPSRPGDSGSPLYLLGRDGKRHLIGQLAGGTHYAYKSYDGYVHNLARIK